jgi:Flp pilus assembly protein TadD
MTTSSRDPSTIAVQQATTLCDLGRFTEAASQLGPVIASDPQNTAAWCVMSRALLGQQRSTDAFEAARNASAIAPDAEWPQRLMSIAKRQQRHSKQALRHATEAVRLAPHEWRTHMELAHAEREAGNLSAATAAAKRAIELAPNEPSPHMALGMVHAAAGRRDEAASSFQNVLALDPDNAVAHNELARLQVRNGLGNAHAGRFAAAAGGFAAAIRVDPGSETSRRNLDVVLRSFLRLLAYFIFLDAWIAYLTRHLTTSAARLTPIALLALPIGYALWFAATLPRNLRSYLVRLASTGIKAPATALEVAAIAAVIAGEVGPTSARGTWIGIAVACAIIARLILWAHYKQQRRT